MATLFATPDYLVTTVLIPVVLLTVKALLGREVEYWLTFIYYRFNRPYDLDRNPNTHDWAMIYNPGNGCWDRCSLTFKFNILKYKSGVYIHYYTEDLKLKFIHRVSFGEWAVTGKARVVDTRHPIPAMTVTEIET